MNKFSCTCRKCGCVFRSQRPQTKMCQKCKISVCVICGEYFPTHFVKNTGETREKIRAARMKQHFPSKMTSIEQKLHDAFVDKGWEFEMHQTFYGKWQPDFVFPDKRVVVQADGDYWHSLPIAKKRDREFNKRAESDGWIVCRYSEHIIHRDLEWCIRDVGIALEEIETGP